MSVIPLTSEHGALPLAPIERPRSWLVRLMFRAMIKRYGMVPTAFRVMYTRSPFLAVMSMTIYFGLARCIRVPQELRALLQVFVALENGCTFCSDLQLAEITRARIGRARFAELQAFESSSSFTPAEKAALRYARALLQSLRIPDAVWDDLGSHFSERERLDIVWICAVERYFGSMTLPLRIGSDGLASQA